MPYIIHSGGKLMSIEEFFYINNSKSRRLIKKKISTPNKGYIKEILKVIQPYESQMLSKLLLVFVH